MAEGVGLPLMILSDALRESHRQLGWKLRDYAVRRQPSCQEEV